MNTTEAKDYLSKRQIPQLFESMLTGLMYHRPEDPVDYLESCLKKVKELGGPDRVRWDTFVAQEKRTLPPLNGCQTRKSLFRNVLPDSPNFAYQRYDRLPPIHQFSIESDTDLSETAELIEEYTVFDPAKARPWIILLIGGPGSGKGTQSLKIAQRYGFEYISVGELLRKKMIHNATCNRKWRLIAKIITNGELAPQETTITEIKQRLMQLPDARGIVIDGFPRDVAQALSFEDQICTPDLVVFLACTNHQLKKRLETRAAQQGRPDDNPKAIQRRLTTFKQNTIPLVKYFQERGLIVTIILALVSFETVAVLPRCIEVSQQEYILGHCYFQCFFQVLAKSKSSLSSSAQAQLDAGRDEEEVFYDLSVAVDNKLFPTKDPVAGPSELDLSLLVDSSESVGDESEFEDQMKEEPTASEDSKTEEDLKNTMIIFVIGGPGSGKGTLFERVAAEYGFIHLSVEDLVQSAMGFGAERSEEIEESGECEQLVPQMLKDAIISGTDTKGFVIDGYPWKVEQADEFERKLGRPGLVLHVNCTMDTMHQQLLKPTQTSDRIEENEQRIAKHIETYQKVAQPVIEKYQRENLIHTINAEETPDKIFHQICKAINSVQGSSRINVPLDRSLCREK